MGQVNGDLISRSALGIGLCNPDAFPEENRGYADGWNSAIAIINEAPAVDAVEVVRCKECKYCGFCGAATKFLTREEAEAALRKEDEGK